MSQPVSRVLFQGVFAVAALVFVLVAADPLGGWRDARTPEERLLDLLGPTPDTTSVHAVTLVVSLDDPDAEVDLRWGIGVDEHEDIPDLTLAGTPWRRELSLRAGTWAMVAATANGRAGSDSELTCTLSVDGEVVRRESARGPWATVTCGATVGR